MFCILLRNRTCVSVCEHAKLNMPYNKTRINYKYVCLYIVTMCTYKEKNDLGDDIYVCGKIKTTHVNTMMLLFYCLFDISFFSLWLFILLSILKCSLGTIIFYKK